MAAVEHFWSQSRGVDDLSLRNVKEAIPKIFPCLLALFNHSLTSAEFPESWKCALVRPLGKVKSPTSLDQVRPIANLPLLSKILERVVLEHFFAYLEERELLDPRQSGFRPGFSAQSALLRLTDDIRRGVDDCRLTILVLFHFSKAFDSIPHATLLEKLSKLGFSRRVLTSIASYLTGRSQAVVGPDGERSTWIALDQGVPQGSVLGPLLFSLFINYISGVLRSTSCMPMIHKPTYTAL